MNIFKKKRKIVLAVLLVGMLQLSMVMPQVGYAKWSFSDLTDSQYANEISFLLSKNILSGYPDGTFRPDQAITRGEAAVLIGRAIGIQDQLQATKFPDVPSSYYASGYIAEAVKRGIINGAGDGNFHPEDHITRGHFALMLSRAFPLGNDTGINRFSDVGFGTIEYYPVHKLAHAGIAQGHPDGSFGVNDSVTRLQAALFIARALNPTFKVAVNPPTVIKTMYVHSGDGLNVREEPAAGANLKATLANGSQVNVLLFLHNGWAYVQQGQTSGYVNASYLSDQPANQGNAYLNGKVIVIDPGHGGKDPGAVANGLREKDIALNVGLKVRDRLANAGARPIMTRSNDTYITLPGRVQVAKDNNASSFVSIHLNSAAASASGTETFYYARNYNYVSDQSKRLATCLQKRLIAEFGLKDRGVKHGDLHVLRENPVPSSLVELGFITNATDSAIFKDPKNQDRAANAIYLGILDYYQGK